MGDGYDATGVIELVPLFSLVSCGGGMSGTHQVEEESISATTHGVSHSIMRNSWSGIGRRE